MFAAGRALLLLACCLLLLPKTAVGQGSAPAPAQGWIAPLNRDHPLAGTIWSAEKGQAVSPDELLSALSEADIVLLGEVHDSPDHHRLRAWIIGELALRSQQRGTTSAGPAVVFEHIRADQQDIIDRFRASHDGGGAAELLEQLEWDRSGWPSAAMFVPLFDEALRLDLPILGGNAPSQTVRDVARQGLSAVAKDDFDRLKLDQQLEPPLREALLSEIEASHCGLVPASALAPMTLAQQYRDAYLADVLLRAQRQYGTAVLIAGNGHVRSDRAVPWHLRQRAPEVRTIVVAFTEVTGDWANAPDYFPRDPDARPAVDYVWFTPQAERPDPCERMRQRFTRPDANQPDKR